VTPTQTTICTTCDEYLIENDDAVLFLSVSYVRCEDGSTQSAGVAAKGSTTVCSCSTPVRTGGSTNYTITNQGDCFASPTPTPTITPSITPTLPRGPEGCYPISVKTSLSKPDVCDETASSSTYYFTYANSIENGDTAYTNSSCTSTLSAGRFIEDKFNSQPGDYVFEVTGSGILNAVLC